MFRGAVEATPEFRRIRDAEWRDWKDPARAAETEALIAFYTQHLRTPNGTQVLNATQAWTLRDLRENRGCFAPILPGGGKTHISLLAAAVTGAQRPLLILPAALRDKTWREAQKLREHWQIPPIRIVSFETLGQLRNADYLEKYMPDLVIGDEAHGLKNTKAGVTRRVSRFVRRYNPYQLYMSGSLTSRSGREYWHLLRWSLGDASPMPADPMEAMAWHNALDNKVSELNRLDPGALLDLAPPEPEDELPGPDGEPPCDLFRARRRYARRLLSTRGVVGSAGELPNVGLIADVVKLDPSPAIAAAVKHLRDTWETPCGLPFETAMDLWRHEREVSNGLYYRWTKQPPVPWLIARKDLSRFIRETLKYSRSLDTPLAVVNAVAQGKIEDGGVIEAWRAVENLFDPETEAVWICDSTLQFAAQWLVKHKGICWVHHTAFGAELSRGTGIPYFKEGGRDQRGNSIDEHEGPAIASLASCSRGFNLQKLHYRNLFITCPTKNGPTEQTIARTHRQGQPEDDVYVTFLQRLEGDEKALTSARSDAMYVHQTLRQPQRLTVATWLN